MKKIKCSLKRSFALVLTILVMAGVLSVDVTPLESFAATADTTVSNEDQLQLPVAREL